jgi:hypothetical protein
MGVLKPGVFREAGSLKLARVCDCPILSGAGEGLRSLALAVCIVCSKHFIFAAAQLQIAGRARLLVEVGRRVLGRLAAIELC